jgi:hypothetical protein
MKKLIVVSVILAVMLLAGIFFATAQPQDSAKEEKPTFYRLIPGVYVNGWPRFTIHYPKDWVEETPQIQEVFRAASPPFLNAKFVVTVYSNPPPLDKLADGLLLFLKNVAKDVIVISDKPSQLRDGTAAREVELKMVMNDLPLYYFAFSTSKGNMGIGTGVASNGERITEDLKAILYSIEFEPDKDKPVTVPPDIQEFLNKFCSDVVSHDIAKVMTHYSDRFLNSAGKKGGAEQFFRQFIGSITSYEVGVTDFVTEGDRVYLAGFVNNNWGKWVLQLTSIIKDSGEWKWYGNQRDVSP